MQPNNNQNNNQDNAQQERSELERAIATYTAAELADENVELARQRDVAAHVAANQAVGRIQAEQEAQVSRIAERNAHLQAGHANAERAVLREQLASEREAASNANFGLVFLSCIVLAALIGLGIWWYTSSQTPAVATSGTNVTETGYIPPANNRPPDVNVNVQTPPVSPPPIVVPPTSRETHIERDTTIEREVPVPVNPAPAESENNNAGSMNSETGSTDAGTANPSETNPANTGTDTSSTDTETP